MKFKYVNFLLIFVLFLNTQCKKEKVEPTDKPDDKKTEIRKGDFYVSKDGDDNNAGTTDAPFASIQRGVKALSSGQTLIVKAGVYNEFVSISKGGDDETRKINILSEKINDAECSGFLIFKQADNVKINGFKITKTSENLSSGIKVYGNANVEISDCNIFECPEGGIRFLRNAQNPIVANNTLKHNGFFGIYMDASNALIKENFISETVQFHQKCKPANHKGADADGIIIYGIGHKIIGNTIYNIGDPADKGNKNPHSDCIQTSRVVGNTVLKDAIIANNYFMVNHNSGKGIIIESYDTYCSDVFIYNNIFEVKDIGIAASNGKYENIKICNNVFKTNLKQKSWGTAVYLKNIDNYEFSNNITIDCRREHRKIIGGSGTISNNIAYNSDNSKFSMTPPKQKTEIVGKSPNFVKYTGKHGENDYHILENSPAKDAGKTLDFVKTDKDGTKRPQFSSYDIGAYEYK